jgi:hypothetical protein
MWYNFSDDHEEKNDIDPDYLSEVEIRENYTKQFDISNSDSENE